MTEGATLLLASIKLSNIIEVYSQHNNTNHLYEAWGENMNGFSSSVSCSAGFFLIFSDVIYTIFGLNPSPHWKYGLMEIV